MKRISIIIPCYNEQESLPIYFNEVDKVLPAIKDYSVEFILVNDGSKDKTLDIMNDLYTKRNDITIVNLSRNYGQNPALSAGLEASQSDYVILMDSDLQDPVTLLPEVAKKFAEGYDVVNLHRADRKKDTAFKRNTAGFFYRFINKIEGKEVIPENVNCFRGFSRRVVDEILKMSEKDRYLLHEIPLVGFKTAFIDFTREERSAGQSKYTLSKLVSYALDNISAGTKAPLYAPIKYGVFSFMFNCFAALALTVFYVLCMPEVNILGGFFVVQPLFYLFWIFTVTSLIISVIGVLGVYLHNILVNTRNRPCYLIDEIRRHEEKE